MPPPADTFRSRFASVCRWSAAGIAAGLVLGLGATAALLMFGPDLDQALWAGGDR